MHNPILLHHFALLSHSLSPTISLSHFFCTLHSVMSLAASKRANELEQALNAWEDNRLLTSGVVKLKQVLLCGVCWGGGVWMCECVDVGCVSVCGALDSPALKPLLNPRFSIPNSTLESRCPTQICPCVFVWERV